MSSYYEVKISAENQTQADAILDSLLAKKLATGGQFLTAPARFLWKGEIVNMPHYVTITSYTTENHTASIIQDLRKTTVEEVPMVTFVKIDDLSPELRDWIDQTLRP